MKKNFLTSTEYAQLLDILRNRFETHQQRHNGMQWLTIQKRLESSPEKLWSLNEMERTGGEPDVVAYDKKTKRVTFVDCSEESPKGRRSMCYDAAALQSRKEHKPKHSALSMAEEMGITILNEDEYRALQTLGEFDLKTSSWILTPTAIRSRGGALFCDRRYGQVFTYHNGAESYYAARGFRGMLSI